MYNSHKKLKRETDDRDHLGCEKKLKSSCQ